MGNRYGRNQKRKHREQIAALQEMHRMDRALLNDVSKRAAALDAEMRAWDDEVRHLLGERSAFRRRTPETVSQYPTREVSIIEPISKYSDDLAGMSEAPMMTRERMRRFVFSIDRDDFRLQRLVRFIESDGRGGVAYVISDTALLMGFGGREVNYLAVNIANNLVRRWNDEGASQIPHQP